MKIIKLASGAVIGPFNSVSVFGGHCECDGTIYPLSVIGKYSVEDYTPPQPKVGEQ